jgi:hypothetical protein
MAETDAKSDSPCHGLAVAALVLTDAAAGDNPRAEAVIVLLEH